MPTKQIKITPVELEHIAKIDSSIEHWSKIHSMKQLEADSSLSQVRSLYAAKGQFFSKKSSEVGIKAESISSSELIQTEDGAVMNVNFEITTEENHSTSAS